MAMNPAKSYADLANGMVASIKQPVVPAVPVAPVMKEDVAPIAKEESASAVKVEPVTDNAMARMPGKPKKEKRTEVIFVKVTPSVRKTFDALCKKNGVSQADLITYWTELASNSK
ncbi:MAG: hypothetical protein IJ601_05175 [Acidaminococcaceae bacterium]|nr:hypothetical protein [Acidaminococcaceae bacterium]